MTLTGAQIAQLLDALLAAYPRRDDLRVMVRVELNENLDAIAGGDTLRGIACSLIEWAQRTGRIDELIAGARRGNPGNAALQAIAAALDLAPVDLPPAPPAPTASSPTVAAFLRRQKEERLRVLMAQYEAASQQLRLELNAANRPLLQGQLRLLEAEMAAVQAEIDGLAQSPAPVARTWDAVSAGATPPDKTAQRPAALAPAEIDIFLSYSHLDDALMRPLHADLRAAGYSVWIDDGLEPGTPSWQVAIQEAIRQARCMVLLMTPNANVSTWVTNEVHFAAACNKRIFPVHAAGSETEAVPLLLFSAQRVDLRRNVAQNVAQKLLPALQRHLRPNATLMAPSEDIAVPFAPIHPPEVERALAVLTDWEHYPPEERLKAGDELSRLGDPRRGVGVRPDGLPDITWCEIPELGPDGQRQFRYHDGERDTPHPGLPTFWMAQYPITYAQFQVFVGAPDGYRNPEWRKGLADYFGDDDTRWQQYRPLANRPRENVTWPEAVAFCRWLTAQVRRHPELLPDASLLPQLGKGWSIRLPTEQEWVKAARGFDNRLYPWGGQEYRVGYANVDETEDKTGPHYLQETSPVGMYPHAASPFGVEELSGNVWEYCLNKYDNPDDLGLDGSDRRAVRGGYYYSKAVSSSVAARVGVIGFYGVVRGFRVVWAASP